MKRPVVTLGKVVSWMAVILLVWGINMRHFATAASHQEQPAALSTVDDRRSRLPDLFYLDHFFTNLDDYFLFGDNLVAFTPDFIQTMLKKSKAGRHAHANTIVQDHGRLIDSSNRTENTTENTTGNLPDVKQANDLSQKDLFFLFNRAEFPLYDLKSNAEHGSGLPCINGADKVAKPRLDPFLLPAHRTKDCVSITATIFDFSALSNGNYVLVSWSSHSEIKPGFNLYRGTHNETPGASLNNQPILADSSDNDQYFSYLWSDMDVEVGSSYYYWLEEIDPQGSGRLHGPVVVLHQSPTAVTVSEVSSVPAGSTWHWLLVGGLFGVVGWAYHIVSDEGVDCD